MVDATRKVVDATQNPDLLPPTSTEKSLEAARAAVAGLSEADLLSPEERLILEKHEPPTGMVDPSPAVARQWWAIFTDLTDGKTVSEVSEEHGVSTRHVRRIREWGHAQLNDVDRTSIEDLRHRLLLNRRKYRDMMDTALKTKDMLLIMREARANDIVLAKVEGWLIPAIMAPDANIQIIMPDFKQRKPEIVDANPAKEG
jgi:transposase-like protein